MARNPAIAAFCREVATVLLANGFREEANGRNWWLRSELGDYICVDVQSSTNSRGVVFVNIAVVPGPHFDWMKWVMPNRAYGEGPGPELGIGFVSERVRPAEAPRDTDLALHSTERAKQLGGFVARDLADSILPRFLTYLDRDVLLATFEQRSAFRVAAGLRAAYLAQAGDAEGAQAAYGPPDQDTEAQARQRQWLREYAAAHRRA